MSITLMIIVALIVVILVGGKVYLEQKLEKAEKEINDVATEAVKAAEEPLVPLVVEEPVKVEEAPVLQFVEVVEPKKKKHRAKKKPTKSKTKKQTK